MSERKDILDFRDLEQKKERIKGSIQFNSDFEKGYLDEMKHKQILYDYEKDESVDNFISLLDSNRSIVSNTDSPGYSEGQFAFSRKMIDLQDGMEERVRKTVWKSYSASKLDTKDKSTMISFKNRSESLRDKYKYEIGFEQGYDAQAKYPKLALTESEYYNSLKDQTNYQKAFIKGSEYYVAKNIDKNHTISETSMNKAPYDRMQLGDTKIDRKARKYLEREYDKLLTERKEKNRSSRMEHYLPIERPSDKNEKNHDKGMDI